jgi:hypothetical protein
MAMRSLERNGFASEKHRLALFCNGKEMYGAAKAQLRTATQSTAVAEQGVELHRKGVALRFDAKVLHSDAMAVNGTA